MRTLTAILSLTLLACGGGSSTDPAPTTPVPPAPTTPTPVASSETAEPAEIRIYEADTLIMVLEADGSLRIVPAGDQVVGTLGPDNSITVDGRTATLRNDGVVLIDGAETEFSIGPDATLHGPGIPPVKLESDGTISGQSAGARPLRVEGATSPELRRKAMFVMLLATMSGDDQTETAEPALGASPASGASDEGKMGGKDSHDEKEKTPPPAPTGADGAVDDM